MEQAFNMCDYCGTSDKNVTTKCSCEIYRHSSGDCSTCVGCKLSSKIDVNDSKALVHYMHVKYLHLITAKTKELFYSKFICSFSTIYGEKIKHLNGDPTPHKHFLLKEDQIKKGLEQAVTVFSKISIKHSEVKYIIINIDNLLRVILLLRSINSNLNPLYVGDDFYRTFNDEHEPSATCEGWSEDEIKYFNSIPVTDHFVVFQVSNLDEAINFPYELEKTFGKVKFGITNIVRISLISDKTFNYLYVKRDTSFDSVEDDW